MAQPLETKRLTGRTAIDIPSTVSAQSMDLLVAHRTALFVDWFRLAGDKVGVIFQRKPTSDNPTAANLHITGTQPQVDMFGEVYPLAVNVYQESMREGFTDLALETVMRSFYRLQALRRGLELESY